MGEKKDNMERPEEEREAMTEPNEQEMVPTVIQDTETKTEEPKEDVSYDYGRCSKSGSEEMADRQERKRIYGLQRECTARVAEKCTVRQQLCLQCKDGSET